MNPTVRAIACFPFLVSGWCAGAVLSQQAPIAQPVNDAAAADLSLSGDALRRGVTTIAGPGSPGAIAVWGDHATPVICGGEDGGARRAVVARRNWVKGASWPTGTRGISMRMRKQTVKRV